MVSRQAVDGVVNLFLTCALRTYPMRFSAILCSYFSGLPSGCAGTRARGTPTTEHAATSSAGLELFPCTLSGAVYFS